MKYICQTSRRSVRQFRSPVEPKPLDCIWTGGQARQALSEALLAPTSVESLRLPPCQLTVVWCTQPGECGLRTPPEAGLVFGPS